ncbi:hypothetical protein ACFXDH_05070 [Streptomyces sp. NPDC059467]|uniref:hypothetical protein n=1 Tax=Streptomyces sp. NPDC059467 TaxID=3346844 RepID=UPI00369C0965
MPIRIAGAGATVSPLGAAPAAVPADSASVAVADSVSVAVADSVSVAGRALVSAPAGPDFVCTADPSGTAGEASPVGPPGRPGAHEVTDARYAARRGRTAHHRGEGRDGSGGHPAVGSRGAVGHS